MKPYLICPTCGSDDVMKNGMTRRGKLSPQMSRMWSAVCRKSELGHPKTWLRVWKFVFVIGGFSRIADRCRCQPRSFGNGSKNWLYACSGRCPTPPVRIWFRGYCDAKCCAAPLRRYGSGFNISCSFSLSRWTLSYRSRSSK
jgi:hypothetical protein